MDKKEIYEQALKEFKNSLEETEELIPRMATLAAIMKDKFPYYLWCGFYFVEDSKLIIGPYQGLKACPVIGYGGVCGAAAKKKEKILVPNVHKFPGHIVCDERSKSEMVIPIFDKEKRLVAVFDIDSDKHDAFDETDSKYVEKIVKLLFE